MLRFLAACSLLVIVTSPVTAASYTANLTAPATQRIIARDITWQCGADVCQGASADSRPVVLCESLAKRVGKVDRFLVDGHPLSDPELARCNASVRAPAAKALATQ